MRAGGGKGANAWEGRRVRLRPVEPRDWEAYHANDADSEGERAHSEISFPRSPEAARRWAEARAQAHADAGADTDERFWSIETLDGEHVGSINTFRCSRRHGTFSYGLGIFRAHHRRGFGADAIGVLLRHFFDELRYQKAEASVYAFNEASIRLHEQLGFRLEGRRRRALYTRGGYHDELQYGVTREEFAQARETSA